MMLRLVSQQRSRAMMALATGRVQASRGTVLFSTNATEIEDTEANRQEIDQITKQMEDAMAKEKQITQIEQVTTDATLWDKSAEEPMAPEDPRIPQTSSSETMDKIREEQVDMAGARVNEPGSSSKEDYKQRGSSTWNRDQDQRHDERSMMGNPVSAMMDQAKEVMMGTGQILKGTAKVAMQGVKDMADEVLKATGNTSSGQQDQERSRDRDRESQDQRRKDEESSRDSADDRIGSGGRGATEAGDPNARVKEYSEHRQNASLL